MNEMRELTHAELDAIAGGGFWGAAAGAPLVGFQTGVLATTGQLAVNLGVSIGTILA